MGSAHRAERCDTYSSLGTAQNLTCMASKPEGEGPPKPGARASLLSGAFAPGAAGAVKLPGAVGVRSRTLFLPGYVLGQTYFGQCCHLLICGR